MVGSYGTHPLKGKAADIYRGGTSTCHLYGFSAPTSARLTTHAVQSTGAGVPSVPTSARG